MPRRKHNQPVFPAIDRLSNSGSPTGSQTTSNCQAWLQSERRLDKLTLGYSQAEQRCRYASEAEAAEAKRAYAAVIDELAILDALRDTLLSSILASPVQSLPEAWEKLLVLQSRLAGEGGEFFDLLNDVLRLFAQERWARAA